MTQKIEIDWRVWGTPANFNGFRVLASLLQRRRSAEANQTLHDVWPSPALVDLIHFRRLLPHNGILPRAKFTLRPPSLALSYIGSATARHSSSGRELNFGVEHTAPPIGLFGRATITLGILTF